MKPALTIEMLANLSDLLQKTGTDLVADEGRILRGYPFCMETKALAIGSVNFVPEKEAKDFRGETVKTVPYVEAVIRDGDGLILGKAFMNLDPDSRERNPFFNKDESRDAYDVLFAIGATHMVTMPASYRTALDKVRDRLAVKLGGRPIGAVKVNIPL